MDDSKFIAAGPVIGCDPWQNPDAEDQAYNRARRIGRTKSAFLCTLIAPDGVEDCIVELHRRKTDFATAAFNDENDLCGRKPDDLDPPFGNLPKQAAT